MKRYQGRKAKPNLSQWCAGKGVKVGFGPVGSRIRMTYVSGHELCEDVRQPGAQALNALLGIADERDACQCSCHPIKV